MLQGQANTIIMKRFLHISRYKRKYAPDEKSLIAGIIVGILISIVVLTEDIFFWIQLSNTELKVTANQLTSTIIRWS